MLRLRLLPIALLSLLAQLISAQDTLSFSEQGSLVAKTAKKAKKEKNIYLLDNLLDSGVLTAPEAIADAHVKQAQVLGKVHGQALKRLPVASFNQSDAANEIIDHLDAAIAACQRCQVFNKIEKYNLLRDIAPKESFYAPLLPELMSFGYKPKRDGFALAAQYWQGRDPWVGITFSPNSLLEPRYTLSYQDKAGKTLKYKQPTSLYSIFTLSYARNLARKADDFSLNVMHVRAPIYLDITRFGMLWGNGFNDQKSSPSGYYRPSIGFAFGSFSVNYAYTLLFNKELKDKADKHLLQVQIAHVFRYR